MTATYQESPPENQRMYRVPRHMFAPEFNLVVIAGQRNEPKSKLRDAIKGI